MSDKEYLPEIARSTEHLFVLALLPGFRVLPLANEGFIRVNNGETVFTVRLGVCGLVGLGQSGRVVKIKVHVVEIGVRGGG